MFNFVDQTDMNAKSLAIYPKSENSQLSVDVIGSTPVVNPMVNVLVANVLVVFDSRVQELELLYDAIVPSAVGYTIEPQQDALTEITRLLTQTGARGLAIVAHGKPGVVHIGATPLNFEQLQTQTHLLQEWGVEEIALYSCEVGQDEQFIGELERLTGAKVVSTTGKVGAEAQGGSWKLNTSIDNLAFNLNLVVGYQHTLVVQTYNISGISDGFISANEATNFSVTGTYNQGGQNGSDILVAVYSSTTNGTLGTLLYWTVVDNSTNTGNYSTSFNLDTALGNYEGGLTFRFWQGTFNSAQLPNSGNYTGSAKTLPTANIFNANANSIGNINTTSVTTGNAVGPASTYTLDTIAPTKTATITGITDDFAPLTGNVANGSSTNDTTPSISGTINTTLTAGEVVGIYRTVGGVTTRVGTAIVSGTTWSYTDSGLVNGTTYQYTARVEDAAGNAGIASTGYSIIVDNTAPAAGTLSLSNFTDSGANTTDFISTDNTFDLSLGGNEAGSAITYQMLSGSQWVTTTAAPSNLADGTYQFRALVTDAAGNLSTSNIISVTVDNTAPAAGTLSLSNFTDSGANTTDFISTDNSFDLSLGGNEAGSTVTYQMLSDSQWVTTTATQSNLADGIHQFRALVTDAAGNTSTSNIISVTVDRTTPTVGFNSTTLTENNVANTVVATLSATDSHAVTYSLVSGDGSTDNSAFTISGDQLLINDSANYESQSSYSIRLRATDAAGNFTETTQTINVTDVNEKPIEITLSANSVSENLAGAIVGSVTVVDPDTLNAAFRNNNLTISDDRFEVVNGQLKLKDNVSLNYESLTNGQLTVTVTATDATNSALTYSQDFTISVNDVNEAPTLQAIDSATYIDTVVNDTFSSITGTLAASDPDFGEVLTYGINGGSVTNGISTLTGTYGTLVLDTATGEYTYTPNAAAINAIPGSVNPTETFTFTVNDGSLSSQKTFTINLTGTNDAAVLSFANVTLDETDAPLFTSGQLTITDVDNAAEFIAQTDVEGTYGKFSIDSAGNWNYIANETHDSLKVGESLSETFTVSAADGTQTTVQVTINGTNDAAVLSSANVTLSESNQVLSTNGQLTITDVDNAAKFIAQTDVEGTYGKFSIDSAGNWNYIANETYDSLKVGESLSETFTVSAADGTQTTVQVTINGTNDAAKVGESLSETFTVSAADGTQTTVQVTINGTNDVPTDISLSAFSVDENAAGAVIGGLTVTDPDAGDTFTFSVNDDRFEVVDGQLKLKEGVSLGYISNGKLTVKVTATDAGGLSYGKDFIINVTDTTPPDAPVITQVAGDDRVNGVEKGAGVTVSGTAEAGSTVKVSWGDTTLEIIADENGAWSQSFTSAQIPTDGNTTISATATDAAGNTSTQATRAVLIDTHAPMAPTINLVNDTGVLEGDRITQNASLNLDGLENGALVEYRFSLDGSNDNWSSWSSTYPSLTDGSYTVQVRQTDIAGNVSEVSSIALTLDTAAPTSPTINSIAGDDLINGVEKGAGVTVSGTAEAGSTVTLVWVDTTLTTTADASGIWSRNFTSAQIPTDGTTAINVTATDAAGNISTQATRSVAIDTAPPAAPIITNIGGIDNTVSSMTNDASVTGTAEAGSTVTVRFGNTILGTASTDIDGNWSYALTSANIAFLQQHEPLPLIRQHQLHLQLPALVMMWAAFRGR